MNNHDWNKYREEFPERYWKEGIFDEKLIYILDSLNKKIQFKSALDVGGGILGTLALKDFSIKNNMIVDTLDPYISHKPFWINKTIDWSNNNKYDLIVARGSINYLNIKELHKLKEMLSNKGIIIANTFLNPPNKIWSEREAINIKKEVGIERSRLVNNIVEHEIIFKNYNYKHSFYYYSLEEYQKIFNKIDIIKYAKNSSIIIINNEFPLV